MCMCVRVCQSMCCEKEKKSECDKLRREAKVGLDSERRERQWGEGELSPCTAHVGGGV